MSLFLSFCISVFLEFSETQFYALFDIFVNTFIEWLCSPFVIQCTLLYKWLWYEHVDLHTYEVLARWAKFFHTGKKKLLS